jgi:exopolysaccharide biosynthesis protein
MALAIDSQICEANSNHERAANNRLASNSVDFSISDGAQNLQDGITTSDMISIPLAAQALVVVYNLPGTIRPLHSVPHFNRI